MKKELCTYKVVSAKDLKPILTAMDPLNSNRLPIGITLKVLKDVVEVPATGTLTSPWQAVQLLDESSRELYFVSPRVFLGLGFQNQKFVQVIERAFPKTALIEFLASEPTVKVTEYREVSVDNFETKQLEVKSMPVIVMAEPIAAPVRETKKQREAREAREKAEAEGK